MMTHTQKTLAVDRLAKKANHAVVPAQDYSFGLLPKPAFVRPERNEGETPENYRIRLDAARLAYREANPSVFGITHWDTVKLGDQPTDEQIEAEVLNPTIPQAEKIKLAEAHIGAGFSAFLLMDGLKRIGEHKETGTLNLIPKTIAVATWVETVKQTALAGSITFPPAPHTFEEVVSE